MKKKLLILSTSQFGYLTDTLKYCEYAKDVCEITYVGWDYGKTQINVDGVSVKLISRGGNIVNRNLRLLMAFHMHIRMNYDVVFINYTRGISLVRLFNFKRNMILHIRTLRVYKSPVNRFVYDSFLKTETLFFKSISVISEGVARKLRIKKYYLLPLGADTIFKPLERNSNIHLLYVGTLFNRDIIKCVKGFHRYIKKTGDSVAKFTIVGGYPEKEFSEIKKYIIDNGLEDNVICVGTVPHSQLKEYLISANIGVSFVPITPYFEHQPVTKTFEYLLAGLCIIATETYENTKVLKDKSQAILIADDELEFTKAIEKFRENGVFVKKEDLVDVEKYSWPSIVRNSFIPLINGELKISKYLRH
ncbi:MAG: glycosyltransferase [Chitinophagaceae bacterium]